MFFLKKIKQPAVIAWGAIIAFSLLFLGIKCGIIFHFGNACPFWDQWSAEAANLYKPFLEGTLTFSQLLAAHNEHRILMTRLLALLLLKTNGLWSPLFQMTINAALHLGALLVTLGALVHVLGKKAFFPLLLFMLIFFSIPYGWENTLAGFQSQFYFSILFSVLALFFIIEKEPLSLGWWIGILFSLLAFFSAASGVFALAAGAAVLGIQYFFGSARALRSTVALVLMSSLIVFGILMTPTVAHHASLKVHSAGQFFQAVINIMSWPLPGNIFWSLLVNGPAILFCGKFLFLRAPRDDRRWLIIGFVIWVGVQALSIAYGRSIWCLSSRYLDFFAFSVLINFACLLERFFWRPKKIEGLLIALWLGMIFYGVASFFSNHCHYPILGKRSDSIAQTINVNRYQASGDIRDLQGKAALDIPYPNPEQLAIFLASPTIQQILPTSIHRPSQEGAHVQGCCDQAVTFLLSHYFILIGLGFLIGVLVIFLLIS